MRNRLLSLSSAFPVVLLLGLLGMTARTATDPDLWWHLRTGQLILETSHVPHADPFSFTRLGQPWIAQEWLSDALFFELWKHGGAAALILFSALITSAGFMLLYLRCVRDRAKPHWAAAATALGALAAAACWGVRPQMFTFTLASLLLLLIERGEDRPKILYCIPPLFLLWLNLHAGFALALVLLFAYGIGLLIETAVGETPWLLVRPTLLRIFLVLVACLALVPLNPSGALLYRYPFDTLRSPGMRSFIGEWFSPDFHQRLYLPFLVTWLLVLGALAWLRPRPKARVIVLLVLTSMAAFDAVRHIPIFILIAVPVIASALSAAGASRMPQPRRASSSSSRSQSLSFRPRSRPLFAGALIILMAVFAVTKWASVVHSQNTREAEQFPQKAVEFLEAGARPLRVFAYYDWGGYVIWKLYPQSRVFVDGRADLYGDDILHQFRTVAEVRNGWKGILDQWRVEAVLVPPASAASQALVLDHQWHEAFRDSEAVLMLRNRALPSGDQVTSEPASIGHQGEKMFP